MTTLTEIDWERIRKQKNWHALETEAKEQEEGIKYDQNKPRLAEMMVDFREPLEQVCRVWEWGAKLYGVSNWKKVLGGEQRYSNALFRHMLKEAGNEFDDETTLLHAAHVAWNALARLQFIIDRHKDKQDGEDNRL